MTFDFWIAISFIHCAFLASFIFVAEVAEILASRLLEVEMFHVKHSLLSPKNTVSPEKSYRTGRMKIRSNRCYVSRETSG